MDVYHKQCYSDQIGDNKINRRSQNVYKSFELIQDFLQFFPKISSSKRAGFE